MNDPRIEHASGPIPMENLAYSDEVLTDQGSLEMEDFGVPQAIPFPSIAPPRGRNFGPLLSMGVIVFVSTTAATLSEPAKQAIFFQLACNSVAKDKVCEPVAVQMLISDYYLYLLVFASILLMGVVFKACQLSDQYGRKPFLVAVLVMFTLNKAITLLAVTEYSTFQVWLLLLAEFVVNLGGGVGTAMAMIKCYISDISQPQERSYLFGVGIAFMTVGAALGPALLSILSELFGTELLEAPKEYKELETPFFLPLKIDFWADVLVVLYAIFVFPESRSKSAMQESKEEAASIPTASLLEKMRALFRPLRLLTYPKTVNPSPRPNLRFVVVALISVTCVLGAVSGSLGSIIMPFGVLKFGWGAADIAKLMVWTSVSNTVVLVVVSPLLSKGLFQQLLGCETREKELDTVDMGMLLVGLLCQSAGMLALPFVGSTSMVIVVFCVATIGAIAAPTFDSAILKFYPESHVGEFFGAVSLVLGVLGLVVPVGMISLYKLGVSATFPGLPYVVAAVCNGAGMGVLLTAKRLLHRGSYEMLSPQP